MHWSAELGAGFLDHREVTTVYRQSVLVAYHSGAVQKMLMAQLCAALDYVQLVLTTQAWLC